MISSNYTDRIHNSGGKEGDPLEWNWWLIRISEIAFILGKPIKLRVRAYTLIIQAKCVFIVSYFEELESFWKIRKYY